MRSRSRRLLLALLCVPFLGCSLTESMIRSALSSGKLVDSLQEGEWTYWHDNGQMRAQGRYSGDHQIGPWTYWYPNGTVEWKGVFSEDRIHGPSTFYFENGKKRAEGWFVDGFEDGRWRLWTSEGDLEQAGNFLRGRAELRWSYYHGDGAILAEGYKRGGEKVGLWQYWGEDGTLYERSHPMPPGLQVVNEAWEDGGVRREGFATDEGMVGRWLTWHRNGTCRSSGVFVSGRPEGRWFFWTPDGELLAAGEMEGGRFVGEWRLWENGTGFTAKGSSFPRPQAFAGSWSEDDMASNHDVGVVLATWLAESRAPIESVLDHTPGAGVPAPPLTLEARTDREPSVKLRRQPWTHSEQKSFEYLITRYKEGEAAARPPAGSRYGRRQNTPRGQRVAKSAGDTEKSNPLLNRQLPVTQFRSGDGTWVDLNDLRGKKNVVLVVLRGFAREVCVYCVTQTAALAQSVDEFKALDTEVFVLYPGERNRLDSFVDAYKDVTEFEGELPLGVLYDPDYALVERLDVVSDLAIPTTLILDRAGTVCYAYVGSTIQDRPPVSDLKEVIEGFPKQ